ncbi:MAG: MBL fold metallo-hydrolase [Planctomycetes bacterium]|nr:MBL fold metallo-hydrolase [Planctomycetota bacterium]
MCGLLSLLVLAVPPPCSEEELLDTCRYAIEGYVVRVDLGAARDSGECLPLSAGDPSYRPELVADGAAEVLVTATIAGEYAPGDRVTIPFLKLVRFCENGDPLIPGSPKKDFRLHSKVRYYDSDACAYSNFEELIPPFVRGDGNGDGQIDLGDAVSILNVLFAGAPAPDPAEVLDVNGDGTRDIGDPIYLLNYLFVEGPAPPAPFPPDDPFVRLVIVYDNYPYDPRLEPDWGFSCLVDADGARILIDTGNQASRFIRHMDALAIDATTIDALVLSHNHADHLAGLSAFLERYADLPVYIPASFPPSYRQQVSSFGAQAIDVTGPVAIGEGIHSTGELAGSPVEQEVIVETEDGLIVIVPCAHPGIVETVEAAKAQRGGEVLLLLGGFHLFKETDATVRGVIDELRALGVRKVAPCHCTGDRACELLHEAYGADYIPIGVGARVALPK